MKNYNYYTNVRGGYNKLLLIISILLSLSFISCKNFLSGASMLEDLQQSIEYINEPYADVTINSTNAATESIIPAIGNYTKQYKKTDNIKIEFTPVSKYQFIKWTATPSDAVIFEDEKSLSTTATLINTDNPIKIEPIILERATLSVTPVNTIENPKNSSITISSSIPLKLTPELLDQIEITVDDISVLENFQPPIINEENTTITFIPKRDKMIEIPSGVTKIVKVFVPKDYYYENYETKISLEKDFSYSFKINSTTLTSAEITVSCPASQGDISYTGTKTYYLDNEFSVTVTPNEAYTLAGWNIKYNDETDVEKNILLSETSNGGTTLFVKVLTGSVKQITITPKLELRGSVTVKFNAETGTITPAGEKKYYIGDSFKVEYTPSSNFQFVQWSVTPANAVTFETPSALTTTATIKKTDKEITIEAVCLQRSTVTFAPEIHSEGVPKNSAIVINFSNPIEVTEKDLEKISITMDNLSILEYYQTPPNLSEDKKTVTFLPRRDKLVNTVTGSEIKIVNVKVPGSFYYIEDDNKVSLKDDVIYSFKINSTTEERVKINFSCPSTEGELSYSTYKEYNLDEEITTTCTPKKEYTVTGWKICYADGEKEEVDSSILSVTPQEKNSNTITIKVQTGSKREVTVSPICTPRKKVTVDFDSNFGTTSPSEQKNYYNGDTFTVSFREDSEAQFTTWKVYDYETKAPVTDIITFDSTNSLETTCTVNEKIEKDYHVVIKAEDVSRPSITSSTPIFDAAGVYRDRRIIVMFDKPMDESSIYYTEQEVKTLEKDGYTVLYDKNHGSKPYGYWDGVNEDTIQFKNITICYRRDESALLMKHYNPPYFDETDPTVLRIDPKSIEKEQDGTEIDLMPPAASDILIIISNKMGTKDPVSKKIITLTKASRWNYYTSSKYDNEIPEFKNDFKVRIGSENGTELKFNLQDFGTVTSTDKNNYELYNIKDEKLFISGTCFDNGAGISSVTWALTRIDSAYYETPTNDENLPDGQIDNLLITGPEAEFKTKEKDGKTYKNGVLLDLKLDEKTEGLYKIDFIAHDKNDLASKALSFYFVHDDVAPSVSDEITYVRPEATKADFKWTNPTEEDFWKIEIYTQDTEGKKELQDWNDSATMEILPTNNSSYTVTSLIEGNKYQHKVLFYDYSGNITQKDIAIDNFAPTLTDKITECRKEASKTTLSFALNEPDYWKAKVYTQKLPAGSNTLQTWTVTTPENVERPDNYTSKVSFGNDVSGLDENKLEDGTKYQHKVVLVDYSGNESEPIEVEIDNTPPGKITNFFAGARKDKIDLFYTTPSNDDFEKIELSYGSVDTDTESIMLSKSSNLSKQITGLTNGESYSYYIRTVDYAGNKSEPVSVTQNAKISIGDICYFVNNSAILVSNSYYSGSNIKPAGIVCDITDYGKSTDYSKVRIWDLTKKQNLIWGTMNKPPYSDHSDTSNDPHFYTKDGLATYNKYYKSFPAGTFNNSSSYWYWLKNTKNKNSPVTWYIPTYQEIQEFYAGNYSDLKTTFETLKANNIQVDPQSSPLTTCIPGKYDNSTEKGYTRAYIIYGDQAAITSDVTFRDGQSSNCQCMAQVNLN